MKTKFYQYRQNNSGGSFVTPVAKAANSKNIVVYYFDGRTVGMVLMKTITRKNLRPYSAYPPEQIMLRLYPRIGVFRDPDGNLNKRYESRLNRIRQLSKP